MISLIISTYDKYDFLYIVLKSIEKQTFKDFEVIIAEDCEKEEMKENIKKWKEEFSFKIKHVFQEDIGFRKCKILNEAIKIASENIVIIDGDCILHNKFLKNYNKYFQKGYDIIFGRRCEMSQELTNKILKNNNYKIRLVDLIFPYSKAWTECIYFPLITKTKKRRLNLLGSNMGFTKDIIYKINGFNEEYQFPGVGEDTDLEWRLKKVNVKYIALKNTIIQYHLWHSTSGTYEFEKNASIYYESKQKNEWYTRNGLIKSEE
ncbi:glycosyltransferase [Fusobacterium perfoetens]|uniref:glycosyltransferase n=1 Tax=Fusobacterium perfoetens TaxID=852 RepID=UPI000480D62C|nr:glycosyltransferase [Fusobacterium perfoetens]